MRARSALVRRGTWAAVALLAACGGDASEAVPEATPETPPEAAAPSGDERTLAQLFADGAVGFGIYVPQSAYTREAAAGVAANPLYDYLFLNLEGSYDPDAVRAVSAGVEAAGVETPPTLLVRIPPMSEAGEDTTRARVAEILAAGADGVVLPHIRSAEEARTAVSFFEGHDVWSPSNPDGEVLAMIMLEDPQAIAQLDEIVDIGDFSVLACGIGSLTGALEGDRETAEEMCGEVLAAASARGYADMITADPGSVAGRVDEGYLALLMFGESADEAIRLGREAAER